MANQLHLKILQQGVEEWNQWRDDYPDIKPDLSEADLSGMTLMKADFESANLSKTVLHGAMLSRACFRRANLDRTDFSGASLVGADFSLAKLGNTNFDRASLIKADFSDASLTGTHLYKADLSEACLIGANFFFSNLVETIFRNAVFGLSEFSNVDLSQSIDLETATHAHPSTIGIDTIYESEGKIPESFLLGCGLPQQFIDYIPLLIGAVEPLQFRSCFISYSTKDEEFAKRLHSRLRDAKVRVWFAPEDIKGGVKLYDQIERAIQLHDRLLIVLSENSLQSEWVMTEIRKAREAEKRENRRKLFPIRLADFGQIRQWNCFDADSGKDLAVEVREYFIPDFSNWKDHDSFEKAFERLLRDLREAEDAKEEV
jgi:hypothetical protein